MIGVGTALNVAAVLLGSGAGVLIGERLPANTRAVVTDVLGLATLLIAALSARAILDPALAQAVGSAAVLVVLGALLVGGIFGSLAGLESRLDRLALRVGTSESLIGRHPNFIEGWLTASLLFCVGPLTILGALDDGMGRGIDKLALKAVLDGFAALALASAFGLSVMLSALSVLLIQGGLTVLGWALGSVLDAAQIAAIAATGGLILAGVALRLLRVRQVAVADLLPALLLAPLLVTLVSALR